MLTTTTPCAATASRRVQRRAAAHHRAAVDPDHHRQRPSRGRGRAPDVDRQAVFRHRPRHGDGPGCYQPAGTSRRCRAGPAARYRCRCRARPPRPSRSVASAVTCTDPRSVNLTALPTTLSRIWRRRSASPNTGGSESGTSMQSDRPFGGLRSDVLADLLDDGGQIDGLRSRSSRPASMRERSRNWLISVNMRRPPCWM